MYYKQKNTLKNKNKLLKHKDECERFILLYIIYSIIWYINMQMIEKQIVV